MAKDDYAESFYLFERECADAMLGKGPITQTGAENLRTLACTFAAYAAAERRRVIDVAGFYKLYEIDAADSAGGSRVEA